MRRSVIRLDTSRAYDSLLDSRDLRHSHASRVIHCGTRLLEPSTVYDSGCRVVESRVLDSGVRPTRVTRVSVAREPERRLRSVRVSSRVRRDDRVSAVREVDRDVHRAGELYYYNSRGERVYTSELRVEHPAPYYSAFVETSRPATHLSTRVSHRTLRVSTPRRSQSRSKISVGAWRSYRDLLHEPQQSRVYDSVLRESRPVSVTRLAPGYTSQLSRMDTYDGYVTRRVYAEPAVHGRVVRRSALPGY